MTRRTIDVHIGWVLIGAALLGITGLLIWAATNQPAPDHATPWPQVTRTLDGSTTTVIHPEDLDRETP